MTKGFIYVLSNPALPGLLKIGFTAKIPDARALELESTGVPAPFVVEYYCIVDNAPALESEVHGILDELRYTSSREFFRVGRDEAIQAILKAAPHAEVSWDRRPLERQQSQRLLAAISKDLPLIKGRTAVDIECPKCGATYWHATYCPLCKLKLR